MSKEFLSENKQRLSFKGLVGLWPYLWPKGLVFAKVRLIIAFTALIFGKIAVMTTPLFLKYLIDSLQGKNISFWITAPAGLLSAYALSRLVSGVMNEIRDAAFIRIGHRAMREAGIHVFRHLHHLSLGFHLERNMGSLTQTIQRGTKSIEDFMRYSTFSILPTLIEVLFVITTFSILYSVGTAMICAAMLVGYVYATFRITKWRMHFIKSMNQSENVAQGKAIDSLLNYETVKYFNNEELEIERYDRVLGMYEDAAVKSKVSLTVLNTAQNSITSIGLFAVLMVSLHQLHANALSVGDFVAINAYLFQIFNPLYLVGFAYHQMHLALINMDQMFSLLQVKRDVQNKENALDIDITGGEIAFQNVSFAYHASRPILKGLSFKVPARKALAVVGLSGAGKSTIAKLLYRFYDVSDGAIYIDGQDIRNVTQESLRKSIGVVPQDTVLFNDTIFYNIQYGKPSATREDVIDAAQRAQLHDFIMSCPEGYETVVGERGLKLSGGEKQRVAIARVLLENPPILVFDEATSALDSHTEKAIQNQLEGLSKHHTTIMIAHRLSTVVHAHHIIMMDQGRVVEEGTHGDLLEKNGVYTNLWYTQSKKHTAPS